jgi:hypothetical protein
MKLLNKLRALFERKSVPMPPAPLYTNAEFLEFIAAQARNRTREEQAGKSNLPASPLGNAA